RWLPRAIHRLCCWRKPARLAGGRTAECRSNSEASTARRVRIVRWMGFAGFGWDKAFGPFRRERTKNTMLQERKTKGLSHRTLRKRVTSHCQPAIHMQHMAGDIRRRRRAQEKHGAG